MVKLRGAISGTHPLSEELIQAVMDYKYGRDSKDRAIELFHKELKNLIDLQIELGFPVISNGSLGIEDLIRPFTRSLESLKSYQVIGDLPIVRYHYTNTFFRQPTLISKFPDTAQVYKNDKNELCGDEILSQNFLTGKNARLILPGPLTFANMINYKKDLYDTYAEFIIKASNYLGQEISSLPANFVELQLDEPTLVWKKLKRGLREDLTEAYNILRKASGSRKLIVNTYFEPSDYIIPFLLDLPIDGIGIDFIQTNILNISEFSFKGKIIQAGLMDAQNYIPNKDGSLDTSNNEFYAKFLDNLLELSPQEIIVSSNTGLDYLPREIADAKLRQIHSVINLVEEN